MLLKVLCLMSNWKITSFRHSRIFLVFWKHTGKRCIFSCSSQTLPHNASGRRLDDLARKWTRKCRISGKTRNKPAPTTHLLYWKIHTFHPLWLKKVFVRLPSFSTTVGPTSPQKFDLSSWIGKIYKLETRFFIFFHRESKWLINSSVLVRVGDSWIKTLRIWEVILKINVVVVA